MEPDGAPRHGIGSVGAAREAATLDRLVSGVIKLYAHLPPQSLGTLGSLVRALDVSEDAWMDAKGQALVSSDTASVLIVGPDNVHRCARLIAQQARDGVRLRLSVTGHWAGMISLFYETADVDRHDNVTARDGKACPETT